MVDTTGHVLGKAKYKYDSLGKLLQAGELLFKYYENGLLRSVEDRNEIDIYMYDSASRPILIYFSLKPGLSACGNRTTEWKAEYNNRGQLTIEYLFTAEESTLTKYHEYSNDGLIIKTTAKDEFFSKTITKYFYEKGTLKFIKAYDDSGKLVNAEQYVY